MCDGLCMYEKGRDREIAGWIVVERERNRQSYGNSLKEKKM